MSQFLDALAHRVLIYDGAMGTNIQSYQLTAQDYGGQATEGCNEYLVLTKPSVIEEIHTGFLEAGCDVLETDSFTASRLKLDEYGLGALTHEVNLTAAQLARRLADRYSTAQQPRFVAGSIGPTGMLPSSDDPLLSNITYQQLVEIFREQASALLEGGVDVLLIETSQDILEVRATITGMRHAMQQVGRKVPIQAQVSLDTSGRMLLGTDIAAVMATLVALRVDIIGLNCSTGPELVQSICANRYVSWPKTAHCLSQPFPTQAFRSMSTAWPYTQWNQSRWQLLYATSLQRLASISLAGAAVIAMSTCRLLSKPVATRHVAHVQ